MGRKTVAYKKAALLIACMAIAIASATGCKKTVERTTVEKSEVTRKELKLSYFLTGCDPYTDESGTEKTSIRFLIKNDDIENPDWYSELNQKETLIVNGKETEIYSLYINDNYRYVNTVVPGAVSMDKIKYSAAGYESGEWVQAGQEQYSDIKAMKENGALYFFNGSGSSIGIAGERFICTWLAGFTQDTIDEDAKRLSISSTDNFTVTDADGTPFSTIPGASSSPKLIPNEFGIEIQIAANQPDEVRAFLASTGLVLWHTDDDNVKTSFELEKRLESKETIAEETASIEETASAEETASVEEMAENITEEEVTTDAAQ